MRSLLPLSVLVGLASLAIPISRAEACSCTYFPEFPEAYLSSDAVYLGEVLAVRSAAPEYPEAVWADFRVETAWKGAPPEFVSLLTGANDGICGVTFVPGHRYLVYAFQDYGGVWGGNAAPGVLWTHLCWRTHETWPEDPDLVALGPTAVHGASWGQVKRRFR